MAGIAAQSRNSTPFPVLKTPLPVGSPEGGLTRGLPSDPGGIIHEQKPPHGFVKGTWFWSAILNPPTLRDFHACA